MSERGYHHGDLQATLVSIARDLVREAGPDGWSMREACRRAGVSQAAPYRHFPDKLALLDAVGARAYSELEERYRVAIADDPSDRALVVARAYLRFALEEPRLFRLIFTSPRLHKTPEARRSYRVFEDAVRVSQSRGFLPPGPPAILSHVIWAAAHGVADLVLGGSFSAHHGKKVADRLLDGLMRGLSSE